MPDALPLRQQCDKGILDRALAGLSFEFSRRAGRDDPAVIDRDEPIETLGLLHIRGRDDDAHAGAAQTACDRSVPRTGGATADRRRSSARRGSADRGRGSASSTARASAACRPTISLPDGRQTARARWPSSRSAMRHSRSARDCPNRPAEKFDVLANAEIGIKVLAETLRHIGDARADRGAMRRIGHVAVEDADCARLNLPCAGDDRQCGRFADAVRTDQADQATCRHDEADIVERRDLAVDLGDVVELRDGRAVWSLTAPGSPAAAAATLRSDRCAHRPRPAVRCGRSARGPSAGRDRSAPAPETSACRVRLWSRRFSGVNCAWLATNTTLAGNHVTGIGVEHDARVRAERDSARVHGREINIHIDIGSIEHREDSCRRPAELHRHWQHGTRFGPSRGAISVLSSMFTGRARHRGVAALRASSAVPTSLHGGRLGCGRSGHLLTSLVELFYGSKASRHQCRGPVQLLLCEGNLGLLLYEIGFGLIERVLRRGHQSLGFLERRSYIAGVHHRDDLPGR